MRAKTQNYTQLKSALQPYVFVLKEGGAIKQDLLDYSLMILYTYPLEKIDSPLNFKKRKVPDEVIMPF